MALARVAAERGTSTLVATPHIRDDYPFDLEEIPWRAEALRTALADAGVELEVQTAGEVAITKTLELSNEALSELCLGAGSYLLVETPYTHAPELLENALFDLQTRGFRPVLAHPERGPSFLSDLPRLSRIVEHGVLCSVTAMSMTGGFGSAVRRFALELFSQGLVHDVASDAHDAERRSPGLGVGFERLDSDLADLVDWFTDLAPAAILAGADVPAPPIPERVVRRQGVGRLFGRS